MNFHRSALRNPLTSTLDVSLSPSKFYELVDLAKETGEDFKDIQAMNKAFEGLVEVLDEDVAALARANNALLEEVRNTSRRAKPNPFAKDEAEDLFADLRHTISGQNFMRVIFDVASALQIGFHSLLRIGEGLKPGKFLLVGKRYQDFPETVEDLNGFVLQLEMNRPALSEFTSAVFGAERCKQGVIDLGRIIVEKLESYHATLLHRHTTEGVQVHGDPVATDIALSIFENVDANGEIQDGKNPTEVSAYSIRKATIVAEAIKRGMVGDFIRDPAKLLSFITTHLDLLWAFANDLSNVAKSAAATLRRAMDMKAPKNKEMSDNEFGEAMLFIKDLDPRNITFKDKAGLMTSEERFALEFQNETVKNVVSRLQDSKVTTKDLVNYILERKAYLHKYYQEENSFYVCKIGSGNPFGGDPPGMLTVVPGVKPVVNIDEVVGAGFDQVKDFIKQIEKSAQWHDLFLATSPSKSADKSNALLIGPQGCGKSEVLRAVGGDRKAIGIYAQPSDFLTCWKGEAEKNPKRLFEAALRLQKESKKQVFILIDEVDTILNDDHARGGFGATNLTTEFQQLMDGILQYPHIAVWAATNHPERIPMPMIRRFNKVAIVGELDQEARVKLLKQFVAGFLPLAKDFPEEAWQDAGKRLVGAVGDTIRKVADYLWREKLTALTNDHPEAATKLITLLNEKEQFHLSRFDSDKRKALMAKLEEFMAVTPKDLMESVEEHLGNIAIRTEIETAVETYERSRTFLAGIRSKTRVGGDQEPKKVEAVRPVTKPGDRVGAILSSTKSSVDFLGYGVYLGDEVPPAIGGMTNVLADTNTPNPKIKLDSGEEVWGCECWWGPEEQVRAELAKSLSVKDVKINRSNGQSS